MTDNKRDIYHINTNPSEDEMREAWNRQEYSKVRQRINAQARKKRATEDRSMNCSFDMSNIKINFGTDAWNKKPSQNDNLILFFDVLKSIGIDIDYEISKSGKTVKVSITTDSVPAGHHAGRKKMDISPKIHFETVHDFLTWLDGEGHTADEAIEVLGVSRSTYFRRLKAWREAEAAGKGNEALK